MTHTEATHNIVFSFNNLLDAMPGDATPADAAALATLFANACVSAGDAEGGQAFTNLSHQLMASQQRRDVKAQPAGPKPVAQQLGPQQQGTALDQLKQMQAGFKTVRPGCAVAPLTAQAVPARPAGQPEQPNPLIATILKAMGPQIEAEAERRIQQRRVAQAQP